MSTVARVGAAPTPARNSRPPSRHQLVVAILAGVPVAVGLELLVGGLGIALFGLVALALVSLRAEVALVFIVFVGYGRLLDGLPGNSGPVSVAQGLTLLALGMAALRWRRGETVGNWKLLAVILGTFAALGLASLLYAVDPVATQKTLVAYAKASLIPLLIVLLMTSPRRLRLVVWAVLASAAVVAVVNLYQQFTGSFDTTFWGLATSEVEKIVGQVDDYRLGGPQLGPNGFAHMLVVAVPLGLDRAVNASDRRLRVIAGVATAVIVTALAFTYSRNGFITVLVAGVLFALYRGMRVRRLVGFGVAAAILIVALAPASYLDRVATLTEFVPGAGDGSSAVEDSMNAGRLSEYIAAVDMFTDHPVNGVGLGNYRSRYLEYAEPLGLDNRREPRGAHSLYLQYISELGVVGMLWLVVVLGVAMRGVIGSRRALQQRGYHDIAGLVTGVEIALIVFFWFSLFRHISLPLHYMLMLGIALAVPQAVRSLIDETPDPRRGSSSPAPSRPATEIGSSWN